MRLAKMWVVVCSLLLAGQGLAQQTTSTSTQGTLLLQKALAALAPTTPISDITLSGTARRIAGSDDESGTAVFKALAGTGSRLDLALPSGNRSEIRNISSTVDPAGSWSGPDGVSHAISYHNLLTDPGWSPALTIASLLSAPNVVVTYLGTETREGQSVVHVSVSRQLAAPSADAHLAAVMQHLTQTEIFLDASTYLPAEIELNVHPDDNELLDIPAEIRFSTYTEVSGGQVPFHVQKFLNNSLLLDLQFTSATLNSGIPASAFSLGGAQ